MKATTTIHFLSKPVCTAIMPKDSQWMINLPLEELKVPLKLDTGSDVSIRPISYNKKLKRKPEIKPTKIRLTSYTGDTIPITGKIYITINRKGMLHKLCFIITPRKVQPIFVAASHQTRLDTRSKARRPIKVGIKGRGGRERAETRTLLVCAAHRLT